MNKSRIALSALALAVAAATFSVVRADEPAKKDAKDSKGGQMECCQIDPKAAASLDKLKALTGTWTGEPKDGQPTMNTMFRSTSNGSAVIETMCPGTPMEMINMYTAEGDAVVMTHYCARGNQPHMKLESFDGKTMKFAYVNGANIKTPSDPRMHSVAITVDGDKLTEEWGSMVDGKEQEKAVFELHKVEGK